MTPGDSSAPFDTLSRPDAGRVQGRIALHAGVRELLDAFSRTASSALNLPAGLAVLCHHAVRVFTAEAATAWLHDRRSRELVLAATSRIGGGEEQRVDADAADLPAALLRHDRVEVVACGTRADRVSLALPLRGRRRALGVIVLEALEPGVASDPDTLEEAEELARQLSAAIENLLLLEDVLRSRRELARTFDSLEDLVAVCDHHLRVAHVNRTLADRLTLGREHVIDRPLVDLVGREAGAWIAALDLAAQASSGATAAHELDDPVLGGRFAMTVTPLSGPDLSLQGAVFVARDITGQVQVEAERAALKDRLTQSEKLAALGQFVAGIAHELNNPLQAVLGHIELLRHQGRVPPAIRKELALVFREADRAARIVDNLLVFAGGRRFSRRALRLSSVVASAVALRARACRAAGIEIARRHDDPGVRVMGNRLLLQQALFNILLNAEQELAGRGGGRIEVATTPSAGGRVRIDVRDTGPGIKPEVLQRIFEPFFTTKDVGKGTGLGLAIGYGIVKEHGGTMTAANHPEGGAVFTIELPTVKAKTGPKT